MVDPTWRMVPPLETGMASPVLERPARGSTLSRSAVLGSVNWAFVITLLLLLVFVFMWWTATDDRDKARGEAKTATESNATLLKEGTVIAQELDATSKLLGFLKDTQAVFGPHRAALVDREKAVQHLNPNGELEVKEGDTVTKKPGMLNMLKSLKLKMLDSVRSASGVPAEAQKTVDFAWMSAALKSKLREAKALLDAVPPHPVPPMDTSDEVRMAKYRADLETYTNAYEAYFGNKAKNQPGVMEKLNAEFAAETKQYKELIAGQPFDPDTSKEVELLFGYKVTGNELSSFELLMPKFEEPFLLLLADYKANKEKDVQTLAELRGQVKARDEELNAQKTRYDGLVASSQAELTAKSAELDTERTKSNTNEAAARKAEQDYIKLQSETKLALSKLNAQKNALEHRVAGDKEERDLEIRRNEVDGTILAVDNASEVGTIDLGSRHKVYPGLKFQVSFVDRGGARQPIGEVQVIKVTGPSSSQVRILSAMQPLVGGHLLSNPLFNASRPVHIYPLGWSPDVIQQRRLDEMGVVVDKAPTAGTDYFVVPNDWKGGAPAAPKEGEDPAAAAASNPLDKAQQEARTFGATVITLRMLENFLRL
jgi:hypothetical protein